MGTLIVGLMEDSALRINPVGARGVVHMLQFNGKQERVKATQAPVCQRQHF